MYSRIGFNAPSKHGVNAVCTRKDFLFSTTKLVRSGLLGYVGTVLFFLLRMFFNKYQRREDLLVERASLRGSVIQIEKSTS